MKGTSLLSKVGAFALSSMLGLMVTAAGLGSADATLDAAFQAQPTARAARTAIAVVDVAPGVAAVKVSAAGRYVADGAAVAAPAVTVLAALANDLTVSTASAPRASSVSSGLVAVKAGHCAAPIKALVAIAHDRIA